MEKQKKSSSKGMWADRNGSPYGADHNNEKRAEALADINARLEALFRDLKETEKAIEKANEVLAICQPNGMSGRYSIRWWYLNGQRIYREPVLVRWVSQNGGKSTPKPVKIARAKRTGSFALNADHAQECLNIATGLIKKRAEIKVKISTLKKSLQQQEATAYYLNNERLRLDGIMESALQVLVDAGYEVEHHYFQETDAE